MIALSTFGNLIEKMAKISIIVPIYSVEKYLQRCIASLRNQTFKDIEIILVDDESPDNCPSMCDEYAKADSRIKVIHKKNGGLGYARNSGLEIASGDYVAFVDSDDYVELDMIETLYQECEANKLDAVFADFYVDGNDGFKKSPSFEKLYVNKEQMEELRLDLLGAEPEFPSCSKIQYSVWRGLYSMKLIKKNNLRFPSEREYISEDIVFNLDFFTDGFTEILHKVRAHAGGVTRGVFSLKRGICEFHPDGKNRLLHRVGLGLRLRVGRFIRAPRYGKHEPHGGGTQYAL